MKFRPHRGTLDEAMEEVAEIGNSLADVVAHMRARVEDWYPPEELPTVENTVVKKYAYDDRIRWDTHVVLVNGMVWGFTDGPCKEKTDD